MQDRRSSSRISVNIPVKLICSNDKIYLAEIISINEQGFLCLMKNSLPLQTNVSIIMLIPSIDKNESRQSCVVSAEGVVVRENIKETQGNLGHIVAVQFIDGFENYIGYLKKYIDNCMNIVA